MGFFGNLLKGAKATAGGIYRMGKKVTSNVGRVGRKLVNAGKGAVDFVEKTPVLGDILRPATAAARGALGVAESGVAAVERADQYLEKGARLAGKAEQALGGLARGADKTIGSARSFIQTGNIAHAKDALRRGQQLHHSAGGVARDARSVLRQNR